MRKPAKKRNYALNVHFVFSRVMRKPAFPRTYASNKGVFGASFENLLFHVIMHQTFEFLSRHEKTCYEM